MKYITINNNRLHFEIDGSGFPLILLHGFSDDLHFWDFIVAELKKYFTVIRLDFRGHGLTELGDKKISIKLLSKDVTSLLEKLFIKKCYIVGFSLGGSVAIDLAINNKKLVKKLVLISTYGKVDENTSKKFKEFNKALKKSYEDYYDLIIPYILPSDVITKKSEELCIDKNKKAQTSSCEDYRKILHGIKQFDEENRIKQINAKTLIIAGKDDALVFPEQSKYLHKNINNSQLKLCDGVKHNVFIGNNELNLKDEIMDFLRTN